MSNQDDEVAARGELFRFLDVESHFSERDLKLVERLLDAAPDGGLYQKQLIEPGGYDQGGISNRFLPMLELAVSAFNAHPEYASFAAALTRSKGHKRFVRLSIAQRVAQPAPGPGNLPRPQDPLEDQAEVLEAIAAHVERDSALTLFGLPGAGKSTLALQYAEQHAARYPGGRWWVSATGGVAAGLARLANVLRGHAPPLTRAPLEAVFASSPTGHDDCRLAHEVKLALQNGGLRALVILDDVVEASADLPAYLPSAPVDVLVTTQDRRRGLGRAVQIAGVSQRAAAHLADRLVGRALTAGESRARAAIFDALGWLPLAVRMASRYVADTRVRWDAYEPRSEDAVVDASLGRLAQRESALLAALARFAVAPIAVDWLEELARDGFEMEAEASRACTVRLRELGIVDWTLVDGSEALALHGLVRLRVQRLAKPAPARTEHGVGLDAALYAWLKARRRADSQRAVLAVLEHLEELLLGVSGTPGLTWAESVVVVADQLTFAGRFPAAIALLDRAVTLATSRTAEPQAVCSLLAKKAVAYDRMDELELAEGIQRKVLEIQEAAQLSDRFEFSETLAVLAAILQHKGQWDEADALYQRALVLQTARARTTDQRTKLGKTLRSISSNARRSGRLPDAVDAARRAFDIFQSLEIRAELPPALGELAMALSAAESHDEAVDAAERGRELQAAQSGPDSWLSGLAQRTLASCLVRRARGTDLSRALTAVDEALRIQRASLKGDNPSQVVATSVVRAEVLLGLGRVSEARELLERVREVPIQRRVSDETRQTYRTIEQVLAQCARADAPVRGLLAPAATRLRAGAAQLIGREEELAALQRAWDDPGTHVLSLVAWGGTGKTSLVVEWMARQSRARWPGFDGVFDWSFAEQGSVSAGVAATDDFFTAALDYFGDPMLARSGASATVKSARLYRLLADRRAFLYLDGLEPLQHPPGPAAGQLHDHALASLVRSLAQRSSGLCVLASRLAPADLAPFGSTAPVFELKQLSVDAGAALLRKLGVTGLDADVRQLVRDVHGHALTLDLLGRYLARAHGGDVRRRDTVRLSRADASTHGGFAFRAMAAYERWLPTSSEAGQRALALLYTMGLFDRAARSDTLAALCRKPAVPGLTESLCELDDADWGLAVAVLVDCGFVRTEAALVSTGATRPDLDVHPLVREYFGTRLRQRDPVAWAAAHARLFEYLETSAAYRPDTIEGLQPLYQAIAHGCHAGRSSDALHIYRDRILRGTQYFSTGQLGTLATDLRALACFFDPPWSTLAGKLVVPDWAWLLNETAYCLRIAGRLTDAREAVHAGLRGHLAHGDPRGATETQTNLAELELTLGHLTSAANAARAAAQRADACAHAKARAETRVLAGDAFFQLGWAADAATWFAAAEANLRAERGADACLTGPSGFRKSEFELRDVERAAWMAFLNVGPARRRTDTALARTTLIAVQGGARVALRTDAAAGWLLHVALDHLTLGRAGLYESLLGTGDRTRRGLADALAEIDLAVDKLRRVGTLHELPRGLISLGWARALDGDPEGARAALDEAHEIARLGPMRLHLADVALYRARIFRELERLEEVRALIETCGYHRRDAELADAAAALAPTGTGKRGRKL